MIYNQRKLLELYFWDIRKAFYSYRFWLFTFTFMKAFPGGIRSCYILVICDMKLLLIITLVYKTRFLFCVNFIVFHFILILHFASSTSKYFSSSINTKKLNKSEENSTMKRQKIRRRSIRTTKKAFQKERMTFTMKERVKKRTSSVKVNHFARSSKLFFKVKLLHLQTKKKETMTTIWKTKQLRNSTTRTHLHSSIRSMGL